MKRQPLLQKLRLSKLNFALVCSAVVYAFNLAVFVPSVSHAATEATSNKSKSSRKVSKPTKRAPSKAAKASSSRKRTASRSKKTRRRVIRGQRTIESARVVEIQNALASAGYYKPEPSGEWDESTSKAMSAYQQDNGFRTTGKPDALSLKKLGL